VKYLRYLLTAAIAIALLTFALANRDPVLVRSLPDGLAAFTGWGLQLTMPLFVVFLGGVVVGLLIGFVWEWVREYKHRSAASVNSREVSRLERELAVMKDAAAVPPRDEVLALLERKKAG
jgi:uncharacterized integral membrane protein